jgi:hypothetical protein
VPVTLIIAFPARPEVAALCASALCEEDRPVLLIDVDPLSPLLVWSQRAQARGVLAPDVIVAPTAAGRPAQLRALAEGYAAVVVIAPSVEEADRIADPFALRDVPPLEEAIDKGQVVADLDEVAHARVMALAADLSEAREPTVPDANAYIEKVTTQVTHFESSILSWLASDEADAPATKQAVQESLDQARALLGLRLKLGETFYIPEPVEFFDATEKAEALIAEASDLVDSMTSLTPESSTQLQRVVSELRELVDRLEAIRGPSPAKLSSFDTTDEIHIPRRQPIASSHIATTRPERESGPPESSIVLSSTFDQPPED